MKNKIWTAALLFAAVPIVAVLYLFYFAPSGLHSSGLPNWLLGFLFIELAYCLIMWWFIKKVWV